MIDVLYFKRFVADYWVDNAYCRRRRVGRTTPTLTLATNSPSMSRSGISFSNVVVYSGMQHTGRLVSIPALCVDLYVGTLQAVHDVLLSFRGVDITAQAAFLRLL